MKKYNYQRFFEQSQDLMCLANMEGFFLKLNPSFVQILGYAEEELLSQPFINFIHHEDVKSTIEEVQKLTTGALTVNFENRYLCKDGNYKWLSWKATPDLDNQVLYATARDVSAYKRMQELLADTQRMAEVGGWELNFTSQQVIWTEEVYRIHEVPINTPIALEEGINFYHPKHRSMIQSAVDQAVSRGESYDLELILVTAKKKNIWVRAKGAPIKDGETVIGLKGTFQKIHRRKLAEIELRQNTNFLQSVMDNIPAGIFWKDRGSNYIGCNVHFASVANLNHPDDIVGKNDFEMPWGITEAKDFIADDQGVMETGEAKLGIIESIALPNGERRWLSTNKVPLRDDNQQVIGVLGMFENISQRKKAEEKLIKSNKALEQSNEELKQFAYIASHDLQEPLRKINAFGERLLTTTTDAINEKGKQYLGRMTNAVQRMEVLIDDLLRYSRIINREEVFESVKLNKIIFTLLDDLDFLIKKTNTEIRFEPIEKDEVIGVPVQMYQLFQNIITNAIKFKQADQDPIIEIKTKLKGNNKIEIRIKDNGIGLDMKYKNRIFKPFQRLHGRTKYVGTGIGLAICQKIILLHKGNIDLESTLNKGTTFIIELPNKHTQND